MIRPAMYFFWACCLIAAPFNLHAAITTYAERAAFDAVISDQVTESFETPFEESTSVSFDAFTVTEESEFAILKSRTDYVSDGERSLGFTWNGDTRLLFEFDPPITAFAADILDFGTCCNATSLKVVSQSNALDLVAAVGPDLPRGNVQFFGFAADEPISALSFSSQSLSDNDLIVFDRVSVRSVPESSAHAAYMALFVLLLMRKQPRSKGRFSST